MEDFETIISDFYDAADEFIEKLKEPETNQ